MISHIEFVAKCIRTAKVQKDWAIKQALHQLENGVDVDDVIYEIDNAEISEKDIFLLFCCDLFPTLQSGVVRFK